MMEVVWIGFNPLHCGAVVASGLIQARLQLQARVSIPFIAGQWSLLTAEGGGVNDPYRVSIPFIAGQWSLPRTNRWIAMALDHVFQSPSLRGSGRFDSAMESPGPQQGCFNPLHCGAVVASSLARLRERAEKLVSIPFIAGQWSLRSFARS